MNLKNENLENSLKYHQTHANKNNSSSNQSSSTTPSSIDTIPGTQEAASNQELVFYQGGSSAWGVLYPIDPRFYNLELHNDIYTFGRGGDCSYSFDIPTIRKTDLYKQYSKQHFTLKRRKLGNSDSHNVEIVDTSMNGVYINGERLTINVPRLLCSKDEIALAQECNKVFFFFDLTQEEDPNLPESFKEKYIMHKILGSGAFGEVRIVIPKCGLQKRAVKIINKQKTIFFNKDPARVHNEILKEAKLMLSLHHPCIMAVHDVIESQHNLYIILELACGGDLYTKVTKLEKLGDRLSKLYFIQMARALTYLHDNCVTHRDLKPENILLMSDENECLLKVTDFGVSRLVDKESFMKSLAGTPSYIAPEQVLLMRGETVGYTKQVDCWSLGVILFVCLVGYPPFARERADTNEDLLQQILKGKYNFNHCRWTSISDDAKSLVKELLEIDPVKRLTARRCLEHNWLVDDELKKKVDDLTFGACMPSPSQNLNVINRIVGQNEENSANLQLLFQPGKINNKSMVDVRLKEKRKLRADECNGMLNVNDDECFHSKEKRFAGPSVVNE